MALYTELGEINIAIAIVDRLWKDARRGDTEAESKLRTIMRANLTQGSELTLAMESRLAKRIERHTRRKVDRCTKI